MEVYEVPQEDFIPAVQMALKYYPSTVNLTQYFQPYYYWYE